MTRERWVVTLGLGSLLAAFAGGIAVGRMWESARHFPSQRVVMVRGVSPLFEDLGLSADQEARIDSILASLQGLSDSIGNESSMELAEVTDAAQQAILETLTPDQREAYGARLDSARIRLRMRRDTIRP